jgi:hypothetical protein
MGTPSSFASIRSHPQNACEPNYNPHFGHAIVRVHSLQFGYFVGIAVGIER